MCRTSFPSWACENASAQNVRVASSPGSHVSTGSATAASKETTRPSTQPQLLAFDNPQVQKVDREVFLARVARNQGYLQTATDDFLSHLILNPFSKCPAPRCKTAHSGTNTNERHVPPHLLAWLPIIKDVGPLALVCGVLIPTRRVTIIQTADFHPRAESELTYHKNMGYWVTRPRL